MKKSSFILCFAAASLSSAATYLLVHQSADVDQAASISSITPTATPSLQPSSNVDSTVAVFVKGTNFEQTAQLYARFSALDAESLRQEIEAIAEIEEQPHRELVMGIALSRLAELDPELALALIEQHFPKQAKTLSLWVWRAWVRHDFNRALAFVGTEFPNGLEPGGADEFYRVAWIRDESLAKDLTSQLGVAPSAQALAQRVLKIAIDSTEDAFEQLNQIDDNQTRATVASALARFLVERDGFAARNYIAFITDKGGSDKGSNKSATVSFKNSLYRELAELNPAKFLAEFSATDMVTSVRSMRRNLARAMERLATSDFELAASQLQLFKDPTSR